MSNTKKIIQLAGLFIMTAAMTASAICFAPSNKQTNCENEWEWRTLSTTKNQSGNIIGMYQHDMAIDLVKSNNLKP